MIHLSPDNGEHFKGTGIPEALYFALQFRQGTILYTLQGDPRIRDESDWNDSDVQNTGPIRLE